ncbi:hypothetical protein ES703_48579 [subsurface metagenome]
MTLPVLDSSEGSLFITPGLAVAICDFEFFVQIVAITLPPKAGLVCRRIAIWPFRELSLISNEVQSAVKPHPALYETIGASILPRAVAPNRMICGQ